MFDVWTFAYAVPTAVVMLGGIAHLFAARRRSRRATGLALVSLFGMLLMLGYQVAFQIFVIQYVLNNRGLAGLDMMTVLGLHATLLAAVHAALMALLIAAVTIDRRKADTPDDE